MSTIDVKRAHGMTQAEALEKLGAMAHGLETRYGISIKIRGETAEVKGRGVKGQARVDETMLHLSLKLGLPARLVAGKIEAGINRSLEEHFG